MLVDSDKNVHQKGKTRMKHSFSKRDAALARNQTSNAWSRRNFDTNNNRKYDQHNTWACSKAENRITENVDFFESKDREIWPDLTGNQTPCRWRLPVTDFQSQEVRNLCLISIQNARKMCLFGLSGNLDCFESKDRATWSRSDWKSDSLSLTSGPRVMRARQRLLKLPRSRKPDLCQLPRAFWGEGIGRR